MKHLPAKPHLNGVQLGRNLHSRFPLYFTVLLQSEIQRKSIYSKADI